jgi:membrane protein
MPQTASRLNRAWDWGGLTVKQLAVQTYGQMVRHETLDRAAIVAFYGLLSMAPFLSLVVAAALGRGGALAVEIVALSRKYLAPETCAVIEDQVQKIQSTAPIGVLSLSFGILLWSSSSAFIAVMDATNAAYGSRDQRSWWRRRLIAIVLTVVESALLIAALVAILAWPHVWTWIGLGSAPAMLVVLFQWVVAVVLLLLTFSIAYYFTKEIKHSWEWVTPGGVVGVLALIAATLGFRLYLRYGFKVSETYGTLAGVVLLLLWFYIAALTLLVGAEVNNVIEQASKSDKNLTRQNT